MSLPVRLARSFPCLREYGTIEVLALRSAPGVDAGIAHAAHAVAAMRRCHPHWTAPPAIHEGDCWFDFVGAVAAWLPDDRRVFAGFVGASLWPHLAEHRPIPRPPPSSRRELDPKLRSPLDSRLDEHPAASAFPSLRGDLLLPSARAARSFLAALHSAEPFDFLWALQDMRAGDVDGLVGWIVSPVF